MAVIGWAWLSVAVAQDYVFPTTDEDYGSFYPTAYLDEGGVTDWNCGGTTYEGHRGSDFGGGGFAGMDEGRTVVAAADGVVSATNDGEFDRCTTADCPGGGGFGNYVMIAHADGKSTIYGHLKQWSVSVAPGDAVTCGQTLGEMGSSGFSTGPHVHFEVRNTSNVAEDPFDGPCSAPPAYWVDQGVYEDLPDNHCGPPPECAPVSTLACGDAYTGANDDAGSTTATWDYGCTEFVYSGPELAWTFSTPADEPVTLSATGLTGDLDLYVVDGVTACDGSGCVAASSNPEGDDESVTFDAAAGRIYVVVVDGWEGTVSPFTLSVACDGAAPEPPDSGAPTEPTDPTDPTTDGIDPTDAPEVQAPGVVPATDAGCGGCASGGGAGWVAGLGAAAFGLGSRVRRRR
ncbi:MAG: peptidoglycan DD-metalloendopeptidase family protein [Myxococcota bacterium]